jgi:adenosyl cobinamide kinase/adenosyl cobinamide phosphate guanylyltransferase
VPVVLLIGGARSGKSALALRLAATQRAPVVFVATAEAGDAEMSERIERHRRERPAAWDTVEEPLALQATIEQAPDASCLIVDCLTLWTANALAALGAAAAEAEAAAAAAAAACRSGTTIVVTNEVGLGIVPDNELSRDYRDLLGRVNSSWAELAERVLLLIAGRVLPLERSAAVEEWLV